MTKLTLISTLSAIVVAVGGSLFYYVQHRQIEGPASVAPAPQAAPIPLPLPKESDMQRRKLEGIGSTKNLKPVPIPNGDAR